MNRSLFHLSFLHRGWHCAILGLVGCVVGVGSGLAQQAVALPAKGENIEIQELRAALEATQRQVKAAQEKSAALEKQNQSLAVSLAEANRALEKREAAYKQTVIQLESLGVDVLNPDPHAIEQRLLKAVRERDAARVEASQVSSQLGRVVEGVLEMLSVPDDAVAVQGAVAKVKKLLENSGALLAHDKSPTPGVIPGISQGRVVSVDPKIGLVVLNLGQTSGMRVGMPLAVYREDRAVGSILVVDVRDSIAGALVRERSQSGEDVKVGDRVELRAGDKL